MKAAHAAPSRWRGVAALLLWLALMAAGVLLISRAQFSADLSAFLPAAPDPQQRALIDQLQSGIAARTLLLGIEGGDPRSRADASRSLAAALRGGSRFEQVSNGDAAEWSAAGALLFEHRYRLSPAVTPQRFTADGLRDAIDETLSLLGTPAGAAVKPVLERDPTGETVRIAESLIPANAPRSEGGVWVSRTAPRAVLVAITRAAAADLDAQAAALASVRDAFAPLAEQGLTLLASGPAVFATTSRELIEREVIQLAVAGAVVVGALLWLAFASLRALALAWLPVATGIVAGIVAVSLGFGAVHGITLGFGSTLIGEAVDYAIYYLIQARQGSASGAGWQRWRDANWPTVRLGLATSVCGFGALVFSGFPGLAQLGLFSLAGLTAAALATRYVLPALAPNGAAGEGSRRTLGRVAALALRALPAWRNASLLLGAAACVLLAIRGSELWRGDLASLNPAPLEAQQLDTMLRADLGASDARIVVIASGSDRQAALRAAEAAGERLDAEVARKTLAGFETPARLLPSEATQQARIASLPDAQALRDRLAQATAGAPLAASRLEPFIADVQAARSSRPLTHASLAGTALAPLVDSLLFNRSDGGWSALIALHAGAREIDAAGVRAALEGLPGAEVIDIKAELDRLYSDYLREAFAQASLGALAVVLLLALHLRSTRRLLATCAPLALALVLTLAGFALVDAKLGILHLVGLLLIVAVGSNYTLFFDQLRSRDADDDTLASLLLANLTTVASFSLIAMSDIAALSAIGSVVAPGALLALLLGAAFARSARPR